MRVPEQVKIDIVQGVEGKSLYLDEYRIAGPKPWGGGTVVKSFVVHTDELLYALGFRGKRTDLPATLRELGFATITPPRPPAKHKGK